MKLRVLVLGGGGYIGSRVVAALADSDWACVIAAGRRKPRVAAGAGALALDSGDARALAQQLGEFDAVVNCVAGSPAEIVQQAQMLVDAAQLQAQPPLLVHLSSMAVYGAARGLVDEAAQPQGQLSDYGAAKWEAERTFARYPRSVVLRPGCVYGAGSSQWTLRIALLLQARRIGDIGAAGDGYCNLIHADDVVAAVLQSLQRPQAEGRCFNLAMADVPTWNDYFLRFGRMLGPRPVRRVVARRLRVDSLALAPILKIGEKLLQRAGVRADWLPPAIPPSLLALWRQEIRLDSRRAQTELGLSWTPLEQGMQQAADWLCRDMA